MTSITPDALKIDNLNSPDLEKKEDKKKSDSPRKNSRDNAIKFPDSVNVLDSSLLESKRISQPTDSDKETKGQLLFSSIHQPDEGNSTKNFQGSRLTASPSSPLPLPLSHYPITSNPPISKSESTLPAVDTLPYGGEKAGLQMSAKDVDAQELIELLLKEKELLQQIKKSQENKPEKQKKKPKEQESIKIVYSHICLTTTENFIKIILEKIDNILKKRKEAQEAYNQELIKILKKNNEILDTHDQKPPNMSENEKKILEPYNQEVVNTQTQLQILLEAIYDILSLPRLYPVSLNLMQVVSKVVHSCPSPLQQIKELILPFTWQIAKSYMPSSPQKQGLTKTSSGSYQSPKSFASIAKAIEEGKIDAGSIEQIAKDLTKKEAELLIRIKPATIVNHLRKSKSSQVKDKDAKPSKENEVMAYIKHSNVLCYWAKSLILSSSDPAVRAQWCEFYIKLIKECLEIGNFNSAYFLFNALDSFAISHLKMTWKKVSTTSRKNHEEFKILFDLGSNNKNYNCALSIWQQEQKKDKNYSIPIFSLYLKRLTSNNESPTSLNDGHLNSNKMIYLAKQYQAIQNHQIDILKLENEISNFEFDLDKSLTEAAKEFERLPSNSDESVDTLSDRAFSLEIKIGENSYVSMFDIEENLRQENKGVEICCDYKGGASSIFKIYISGKSDQVLGEKILRKVKEQLNNKILCQVHFIAGILPTNEKGNA